MKIWVLQTGEPLQIDPDTNRPMRAISLCKELINRGHDVVLWSSRFDHYHKKHRENSEYQIDINENLKLVLVDSPGYVKHFGISRLIDHLVLARNLKSKLYLYGLPDMAVIGYPPIETAFVMSRFLTKRQIRYQLDVKDAWPELFLEIFPRQFRKFGKVLLLPLFVISNYVFRKATGISAPSETFLKWSLEKAGRDKELMDIVFPLTSPRKQLSQNQIRQSSIFWRRLNVPSEIPTVFFVGSLNYSFDFKPLVDLAKSFQYQVVIAGAGPQESYLQKQVESGVPIILPGWISRDQIITLSKVSQFMVVPLVNRFDFDMSIPNKFVDAINLEIPIITSNKKLADTFLRKYNIGDGFDLNQSNSLHKILDEIRESGRDSVFRSNLLRMQESIFSHEHNYSNFAHKIEDFYLK